MARCREPARLYLRPARPGRLATWVIRDGPKELSTRLRHYDRLGAERALAEYILAKHEKLYWRPKPTAPRFMPDSDNGVPLDDQTTRWGLSKIS